MSAAMIRVSFCLNAGPRAGVVQAAALSRPATDELLKVAGNKLRLKKAEAGRARLFVWGTGRELVRGAAAADLANDAVIAVSLGEDYAGSMAAAAAPPAPEGCDAAEAHARGGTAAGGACAGAHQAARPAAPAICGRDDTGRFYASLDELWAEQREQRAAFYAANSAWWDDGGYNGATDEAAMIGDEHSEADTEESGRFLDDLLARHGLRVSSALDAGAGVGRVTKHVLLRRCAEVHLLEACEVWSKQSRRYLGKKRALSCSFINQRLEEFLPNPDCYDLIWLQWTLQYLVDEDVIRALTALRRSLRKKGLMVLKENRPYLPDTDHEHFQMDTPGRVGARPRHSCLPVVPACTQPDHARCYDSCRGACRLTLCGMLALLLGVGRRRTRAIRHYAP